MAISVLLDLGQAVSAQDLQHFLSYLPEGFDSDEDLRLNTDENGSALYLEIPLPVPGKARLAGQDYPVTDRNK